MRTIVLLLPQLVQLDGLAVASTRDALQIDEQDRAMLTALLNAGVEEVADGTWPAGLALFDLGERAGISWSGFERRLEAEATSRLAESDDFDGQLESWLNSAAVVIKRTRVALEIGI